MLAVAIDGPWLKLAEAVDYVRAVDPRVAVPIHEGETTDPAKYVGMLAAFSGEGVVRRLDGAARRRTSRRSSAHANIDGAGAGDPADELVVVGLGGRRRRRPCGRG